jgi:hypothetical protein
MLALLVHRLLCRICGHCWTSVVADYPHHQCIYCERVR